MQKLSITIKNIFFDFDGVIAESVNIKTEAFYQIYFEHGEDIAKKVVEHHKANGGMSRYEKFKLYHKEFLGLDIDQAKVDELSQQFSDFVEKGVIESPEVSGSHDFILNHHNDYKMFVITGTPTEESKRICKARGLFDKFIEICGSPKKKGSWAKYLLDKYNLKKEETIFVGDALADYNAAKEHDLIFLLRNYEENEELFKNIQGIYRFTNFNEFKEILNTL